jgi:hypothetical protein
LPIEDKKSGYPATRIVRSGKRSLRRPKLSTRKFSAWKKKKKKKNLTCSSSAYYDIRWKILNFVVSTRVVKF